jgi:ribosomal protein L32
MSTIMQQVNRVGRMKKATPAPKKAKARRDKRRAFPYQKVAELWADGKTIAEIAKTIGRVGDGKDPYHALRVFLTRMHHGYKDSHGKLVKLPHRVSQKTVRLAKLAGKKAVS